MSSIKVLVRNGEVLRVDQPELWVRGEQIPPGEERSFDVNTEEPLQVEAKLTEEQEKAAKEIEEADKKVEAERQAEAKKTAEPKKPEGLGAALSGRPAA